MDYSFLSTYYNYFISGTLVTLIISFITIILGTILGVIFALMKLSSVRPFRWLANIYIEVFRGTPMLVQILISIGLLHKVFNLPTIPIGVLDIDFGRLLPGIIADCSSRN
jgi:polar amino acid transport system permease protein